MIKIKWIRDRIAEYTETGIWKSEDKIFENSLNATATPAQINDYVPDLEAAVLELAKDNFPGLEVLEYKPGKAPAKPGEEIDY